MNRFELRATVLAWLVIHGVAAFDCHWAIQHIDGADYWERNPLARALFANLGVWAACVLRMLPVACGAAAVSVGTPRSRRLGTLVVLAAHLYLAVVYWIIFWRSE